MGLTCSDVEKFKFHSLLEISREIDNALGNRIPSDVVSYELKYYQKSKNFGAWHP